MNTDSIINNKKLLLLLLLFIGGARPQQLGLQEALSLANCNNPRIQQFRQLAAQKQNGRLEAWGNFLPKVWLDASYNHLNEALTIDLNPIREVITTLQAKNQVEFSNIYSMLGGAGALSAAQRQALYASAKNTLTTALPAFTEELKRRDNQYLTITVVQPLFTGGKLLAAKNAAGTEAAAARYEEEQARLEVTRDVIQAYLAAVLQQDVLRVRRQVLELLRQHAARADKLFAAGMIAKYQVTRARAAMADAAQNVTDDSLRALTAALWLASLTGSPAPVMAADDSLRYFQFTPNRDSLVAAALQSSPLLCLLQEKTGTAAYAASAQRAAFMPVISAFGRYEALPEYLSALEPNWTVGVRAQYNLFNGFTDYLKLQTAYGVAEEVRFAAEDARQRIVFAIDKSVLETAAAAARYGSLTASVTLAEENLAAATARFSAGTGTSLEVIDAGTLLEKAKLDRAASLGAWYRSLAEQAVFSGSAKGFLTIWNMGNTTNANEN